MSIDLFPNYADLVNPQLSQDFTETLRDNFVRQTSLNLTKTGGDLHFEGTITEYRITPINAQATGSDPLGGNVAQSRLTISVNVIFTNRLDPKKV
ncbi:MAG: LptE family protein [Owenweeksia sp.]|nr:LptE family protein [Owenweeksia sp.]